MKEKISLNKELAALFRFLNIFYKPGPFCHLH